MERIVCAGAGYGTGQAWTVSGCLLLRDHQNAALPKSALDGEVLARTDGAGAMHAFADACRETKVRFSLGYPIDEAVRNAVFGH